MYEELVEDCVLVAKDVEERFFSPSDTMDLEEVRLRLHEMVDKEYASS